MGWLIALAVVILLAILPIGVTACYQDLGLQLRLLIGPVSICLLPRKSKTADRKKTAKAAKKKSTDIDSKKTGGSIQNLLPLLKVFLRFCNHLRKKLRVRNLEVKILMTGDDPYDLALNYGRANAAMGNLLPRLERFMKIQKRDIQIQCDFEGTQDLVYARVDARISFGGLLCLALRYGLQALKLFSNSKNNKKGGASQ